ncbi:MAG TPA: hypothetical protein DHW82_01420 [Spirochaetia bacterium]|nr:MAG: hypothetical protein A2Y41_04835 [Spirochaetes bacterium GWB1_36_13]HCL55657.1 hypothetical protein [Spirochaetia bacterium]
MKKIFILLLIVFPTLLTAGKILQVDFILGKVQIKKSKEVSYQELTKDMTIQAGDVVRTGKSSMVKLVEPDGIRLVMMENSTLNLSVLEEEKRDIQLLTGDSEFKVLKGKNLSVRTPSMVAGVRGTLFKVSANSEGKEKVVVYEGKVEVTSPFYPDKEAVMVEEGKKLEWLPSEEVLSKDLIRNADDLDLEFQLAENTPMPKEKENPNALKMQEAAEQEVDQGLQTADETNNDQKKIEEKKEKAEALKKVEEEKQKVEEKNKWFKLFQFTVGGTKKNGYYYHSIVYMPEINLGEWIRVAFYLSVLYDGHSNFYSVKNWGNYDEWNFKDEKDVTHDLLFKIKYFKIKERGDIFYVFLGNLEDVVIGSGFMVDGFANSPLFPVQRIMGAEGGFDMGMAGLSLFTNDVYNPEIMGGRFFLRPLFGVPILGSVQIGFQVAADKNPLNNFSNPTFFNIGVDSVFPIFGLKAFGLSIFGDVAKQGLYYKDWDSRPADLADGTNFSHFHINDNYAVSVGVKGNITQFFDYEVRYSYLHSGFVADYFNKFTIISRLEKITRVMTPNLGDVNAGKIMLGTKLDFLEAKIGYYTEIGALKNDNRVIFHLKTQKDFLFNFWFELDYEKKDIAKIFNSSTAYKDQAVLDLKVGYQMADIASLVVRKLFSYNDKGEQESYLFVQTDISF